MMTLFTARFWLWSPFFHLYKTSFWKRSFHLLRPLCISDCHSLEVVWLLGVGWCIFLRETKLACCDDTQRLGDQLDSAASWEKSLAASSPMFTIQRWPWQNYRWLMFCIFAHMKRILHDCLKSYFFRAKSCSLWVISSLVIHIARVAQKFTFAIIDSHLVAKNGCRILKHYAILFTQAKDTDTHAV